jgi:hypothetical protein
MNNTKKLVVGLGIAGGALLAAWLFTGSRKKKTREFFAEKTRNLKVSLKDSLGSLKKENEPIDDDIHYV